jgi:hypothetical protein
MSSLITSLNHVSQGHARHFTTHFQYIYSITCHPNCHCNHLVVLLVNNRHRIIPSMRKSSHGPPTTVPRMQFLPNASNRILQDFDTQFEWCLHQNHSFFLLDVARRVIALVRYMYLPGEFESTQYFEASLLLSRFCTAHATRSVMHPRSDEYIRTPSPSQSIGGRHKAI